MAKNSSFWQYLAAYIKNQDDKQDSNNAVSYKHNAFLTTA